MPFPVVTPTHGTAFDIVDKGVANAGAFRDKCHADTHD
ncbi:MAG TPA: hypothetical protein DCP03_13070 [Polaromonas sp.]|nr:hypothetical protein [Polaromonas sp.]